MQEGTKRVILSLMVLISLGCYIFTVSVLLNAVISWTTVHVEEDIELKATELIVVVTQECNIARRLRMVTVPTLLAEGYKVDVVDASIWPEEIVWGPALICRNSQHKEVYYEVGFRTADHVKEILRKP